jgi:hypothetical protein
MGDVRLGQPPALSCLPDRGPQRCCH